MWVTRCKSLRFTHLLVAHESLYISNKAREASDVYVLSFPVTTATEVG